MYFLNILFYLFILTFNFKLAVFQLNFVSDFSWNADMTCMFCCKQWNFLLVKLRYNTLADVKQVARAFVFLSVTKCFFHNLLFWNFKCFVIIKLPPTLLDPVIDVSIVMSVLCKTIMNHDCMQLIRSFLVFNIWLFTLLFKCINFQFKNFKFMFCGFFVFV